MKNLLKRLWGWINEPSAYVIWCKYWNKLQAEKKENGMSPEYWRIWNKEVCPAYRKLSEETPKALRHPLTSNILADMDKPVSQRRYF